MSRKPALARDNLICRGKRIQQRGEWVEGYFFKSDYHRVERESGKASIIITPDCDTFIMVPEAHNSFTVNPLTVGQYTGLEDKNGVRIFEDDIVRYTFDYPGDPTATQNGLKPRIGRVFWSDWRASFAVTSGRNGSDSSNSDLARYVRGRGIYEYVRNGNTVEVIGNVHDNPELLEEDAD